MRLSFLATLVIASSSSFVRAADLTPELEPLRARSDLPALGALLLRHGEIEDVGVVGVRKLGDATRATPSDEWHLGSCGKAMTATLLATFVEERRLAWTSTLGELFADVRGMDPRWRDVTLETVLAHRAGFQDVATLDGGALWRSLWDAGLDPREGRRRVAEALLQAPPRFEPGSKFEYSNGGYLLAGHVAERIAAQPFESLLRERVFAPLEMSSCGFGAAGNAAATAPDQPWGHGTDDGRLVAVPPGPEADNPPSASPAGTVHCSLADWGKFTAMHLAGARGQRTVVLRRRETFTRLHTPLAGGDYTPGGWIRMERDWAKGPALVHDGNNTLNYAVAALAPRLDAALLVVTNRGDASGEAGVADALALLAGRLAP